MTNNYIEVYVKADISSCQQRDKKGLYQRAFAGEIKNFTGVSDVYESPQSPDIVIDTDRQSIEEAAAIIVTYIKKHYLPG